MATVLENLVATREALAARMAEMLANPKPDYSVDGQSVSWASYYAMLVKQYEDVTRLIIMTQPYQIVSQVM